jgi:hypothetical protein
VDFDAMLEQVLALVQQQRRVSYRAIKRRFEVEDDFLEDLKEEILFAHPHIVDEEGRGFVWTDPETVPPVQTCSIDSLRQWCAKPIGFSPLKLPLGAPHFYT